MQVETVSPELLSHVERVNLLWIGRLGDLIVSTPIITSVRKRFSKSRIALIVGPKGQEAARLIRAIDDVAVLPPMWNIPALLKAVRTLQRPSSLLIDLNPSKSKTSAILSRLARARIKLGFDKQELNFCYSHTLRAPEVRESMHHRYERLAKALGAAYDSILKVELDPKETEQARETLTRFFPSPGTRLRIAIHPGNFKKFENRWPEENFVDLTNRLLEIPNLDIGYLAGPGEETQVATIVGRLRKPVPILPPFSVGGTAALLSSMDLFVGNCTGTTHLAIAVGTPTFTILSGYTKAVWMQVSEPHATVTSDSWTSCRDIPVEKVWKALSDVLKTLGRPSSLSS